MSEWWQDLFDEEYLTPFAEARGPLQTVQEVEGLTALLTRHGAPEGGEISIWLAAMAVHPATGRVGYRLAGFDLSPCCLTGHGSPLSRLAWISSASGAICASCQRPGWSLRRGDQYLFGLWLLREAGGKPAGAGGHQLKCSSQAVCSSSTSATATAYPSLQADRLVRDRRSAGVHQPAIRRHQRDQHRGLAVDRRARRAPEPVFQGTCLHRHRVTGMLRQAGLEPLAYHGGLASPPDDYPFDAWHRLVIVARKAI